MDRRRFIQSAGTLAGAGWLLQGGASDFGAALEPPKQFKVAVISDGLSEDFETALKILKSYKIPWVEIRSVWGKYNTEASPEQIRRLKELLSQYEIRCSQVDTALFKCTLPGTKTLGAGTPVYPYSEQMDLLKRASDRAHAWGTDRLRIFAFWRVAEPEQIFPRISEELQKAAEVAKSLGIRLAIENEDSTNVGTVHELAKMLATLPSNVGANYDIGNGLWLGEVPYPDGYRALDPKRIWNMHLKGAQCAAGFKNCQETFADVGQIDLKGQLQALLRDGYQGTMSLECEFKAPGLSHTETTQRSLEGLLKVMSAAVA
ncbi:MAG TPA: sugar phosphate isomerase/epimerase family protein [Terriglobia bacterium]|nr:sugar phosphate isomerase/epimerase family protein [Terriglobia bacterium]